MLGPTGDRITVWGMFRVFDVKDKWRLMMEGTVKGSKFCFISVLFCWAVNSLTMMRNHRNVWKTSNVLEVIWYSVFTKLRYSRKVCVTTTLFLTERKECICWVLLIGLPVESVITVFEHLHHVLFKDDSHFKLQWTQS